MKRLCIALLVCLPSCMAMQPAPEGTFITVHNMQSSKIDLHTGTYTVFFIMKDPVEIKFDLTEAERNLIMRSYDSIKYDRDAEHMIIGDSCWYDPKMHTAVAVKHAGKDHYILIDQGCRSFYDEDKEVGEQFANWLSLVRKIVRSKKEVMEAPKSDIGYF